MPHSTDSIPDAPPPPAPASPDSPSPVTPSFDEFRAAWNQSALAAVSRTVVADHDTPLTAFRKTERGDYAFLLESADGGEVWGRYSFFASEPALVLRHRAGRVLLENLAPLPITPPPATGAWGTGDPLGALRWLFRALPRVHAPPDAGRFVGGAVACIAYDAVRHYAPVPIVPDPAGPDDAVFMVPEWVGVFDRLRNRITILALPLRFRPGRPEHARAAYDWAVRKVDAVCARLRATAIAPASWRPASLTVQPFSPTDEQYKAAVLRAKEYIAAGDIIQVVLSRKRVCETDVDPLEVYRALRLVNPSPYMFYLRLRTDTVVGSSPEALCRVEHGIVTTRPIAGTRPRSHDPSTDARREAELLADPKERAEHVMLVDLGRNDVGRVAAPGSVEVPSYMRIERFSHVMHIVSDVRGRLAPHADALDALASIFPAGTLSGAPKVRAMQIIRELEPAPRGIYGGAVGHFGLDANADTCIAIRTLTFRDGRATIQAGAGIVHDSDPDAECRETAAKSAAMLEALRLACAGLDR